MNPVDVKWSTYFGFDIENNDYDPKSEVVDQVRIWKHKNILQNVTFQIGKITFSD